MGEEGRASVKETDRLWTCWTALREGRIRRGYFRERMKRVREAVEGALEERTGLGHALSGRCQEILQVKQALWSFVEHDGLEPTSNAVEQALRRAVIWRKLSHGTKSVLGSLFGGRVLTVLETLRRQGRNVLGT